MIRVGLALPSELNSYSSSPVDIINFQNIRMTRLLISCSTYAGNSVGGQQSSLHMERYVHVTSASFLGRNMALFPSICSQRSETRKAYTRWSNISRAHSAGSETTVAAEEGKRT